MKRARWSSPGPAWRSSPTIPRRRTAAPRSSSCSPRPPPCARRSPPRCRPGTARGPRRASRPPPPDPPQGDEPLRAGHLLAALAERLPADAVLVEEAPSNRPELHARIPARRPLGFLSAAMGGLGFAVPGAIGLRMARPDRPVVAVVGDGASLYAVQALWSAAHYGAGVLVVILANGGYAVMDRLAEREGVPGPWPGFAGIDLAAMAARSGLPGAAGRAPRRPRRRARRRPPGPPRPHRAARARGRRGPRPRLPHLRPGPQEEP